MFRITSLIVIVLLLGGCGHFMERKLQGTETNAPADFSFLGEKYPCYLELERGEDALRVNCFAIDGELYIHSSRWANLPWVQGKSWRDTIRTVPVVRVEIDSNIYWMKAEPIDDPAQRQEILENRNYVVLWEGITVFKFLPTNPLG